MIGGKSGILQGDALTLLRRFPDECVDLIITSPPYYGLRFYGDNTRVWYGENPNTLCPHEHTVEETRYPGGGYAPEASVHTVPRVRTKALRCLDCKAWYGELGLELYLQDYIRHLVEICREAKRVLKKTGNFYLNLGDKFNKKGSLEFMPEQVAIALKLDGWMVKNKIVWFKPNHTPSSKKRGWTPSYEFVYHLYKHNLFYFDIDSIRIPHETAPIHNLTEPGYDGKYLDLGKDAEMIGGPRARRVRQALKIQEVKKRIGDGTTGEGTANLYLPHSDYHPLGKNPGDMWAISTKGYEDARGHFAVYPLELLYRPILSSCPKDGVVMDIFAGSGTTAEAVEITNGGTIRDSYGGQEEHKRLEELCPRWESGAKRTWIMLEINAKYCDIISRRMARYGFTDDPKEIPNTTAGA